MHEPIIRKELCAYCHHAYVELLSTTSGHPEAPEMLQARDPLANHWIGFVQDEADQVSLIVVCSRRCLEGLLAE